MHVARLIYACIAARLFCVRCTGCSRFISHCMWIFVIFMLYFYFLFVPIYALLYAYAYADLCLSMHNWLTPFHKSISDLKIDPSRATVKLLRATLGISTRHPSFSFGGFKGPEGSMHYRNNCHGPKIVFFYSPLCVCVCVRVWCVATSTGMLTCIMLLHRATINNNNNNNNYLALRQFCYVKIVFKITVNWQMFLLPHRSLISSLKQGTTNQI